MSDAAARKRDQRAREAAGLVLLKVKADEVYLADYLVAEGLLTPRTDVSRGQLQAAVERLLARLADPSRVTPRLFDRR